MRLFITVILNTLIIGLFRLPIVHSPLQIHQKWTRNTWQRNTSRVEVIFESLICVTRPFSLDAIVEEDAVALSEIGSHVRSQDFSSNAEIIVSSYLF
jgi:hypothetical protein